MGKISQILNLSKGDPDTPTLDEAVTGPYKAGFIQSITQDIKELEQHGTCNIFSKKSVTGAPILPSTWVFKVKHFPDGILCKFKARLCERGDIKVEGVDYFEIYSPAVSWTKVRLMMSLITNKGCTTIQVDFSNAFSQGTLVEDIYLTLPYYFGSDTSKDRVKMVMELNKNLYVLARASLYWYNHLKGDFEARFLKPIPLDPYVSNGKGTIALINVDDVLFFIIGIYKIYEVIK